MYRISTGIHVPFAHHVRGHRGPCISIHGHTWKLEVDLGAETLDDEGFVVDFSRLKADVLNPCHLLLDHSLAVGERTWHEIKGDMAKLGNHLVDSRNETMGHRGERQAGVDDHLGGARNEFPGDIKVAVFPFAPTSERLSEWLYRLAVSRIQDDRVRVLKGRIYESLHPTESVAEFG